MAQICCRRYCHKMPQSEELSGCVTVKRTTRKCNNQRHFLEVSKSKVLLGSVAIMCTAFKGVLQLKVHEGVSQSKIVPGSVTN